MMILLMVAASFLFSSFLFFFLSLPLVPFMNSLCGSIIIFIHHSSFIIHHRSLYVVLNFVLLLVDRAKQG